MNSNLVAAKDEDGFRPMLNGQDLTGWVLVNTPPETWSFQDEMLVCTGKPIGEIRTEKMYQNFIMEVEWRHMVPKGNAGIFVWADDITAKGQPFHRGVEVQVLENAYGNNRSHTTHGDIFPIHGAKMTPINGRGGSRAFPTEERSRPSPEWNHYRIECNNGKISLAVNGKVVTQGEDCSPRKGYICIESEGGIVHYRNMKIKTLPDTPIATANIATANRNFQSLYTGLNLNGWTPTEDGVDSWRVKDWVLAFDGKVTGRNATLTSDEKSENSHWIIDVKLREAESSAVVELGTADSSIVVADLSAADIASALDKTGRWNRLEIIRNGGRVSVDVNGKQVVKERQVKGAELTGSLILNPNGPVDFANVYSRSID